MKYQTFEEYLSDKCDCHTNNDPAGFDNWLESLDTQEVIDYAEAYGKLMYKAGKVDQINEILPNLEKLSAILKHRELN